MLERGFNNKPKAEDDEGEAPISTWYIDPEAWEAVRTGHAVELESLAFQRQAVQASGHQDCGGYVESINYACEVLARQRGWA